MTFRLVKASVNRNPFVGLFCRANDELAIVSPRLDKRFVEHACAALSARPVEVFIDSSPYLGVLIALNSKGCVTYQRASEREVKTLKKAGLNVCLLSSPCAPGNTVLCNDRAAVISPKIPRKEAGRVADALGVEVFQQAFGGLQCFAATSVVTNKGLYAYNELSEVEFKHLEKLFKVRGMIGTSNFGVPYNSLGIVANSHGSLAGDLTTGFEIQRIYEALAP